MSDAHDRTDRHRLFELANFVKGVDGLLETVGRLLILFVPPHSLDALASALRSSPTVQTKGRKNEPPTARRGFEASAEDVRLTQLLAQN